MKVGLLREPPELNELRLYLDEIKSRIENEIKQKTYIPLSGRPYQSGAYDETIFVYPKPIYQHIRLVAGTHQGGDSANAQIAAVNRKSRMVRNVFRVLLRTREPLMLLGDPGTGKTMTLQQVVLHLVENERGKAYPIIPLLIRLGEFHVEQGVTADDVLEYTRQQCPPRLRPYLDALLHQEGRLIILFDGMDEMSRRQYSEHTEALSLFAGNHRGRVRTLFSCRITDFSPKFLHQKLVLLPFGPSQIREYLQKSPLRFPLQIGQEKLKLSQLARKLIRGELPIENNNPFILWLLCYQLNVKKAWPGSRVELLEFYNEHNYREKLGAEAIPDRDRLLNEWGRLAFTITNLNKGAAIDPELFLQLNDLPADYPLTEVIDKGKRCGLLIEPPEQTERRIRFDHHRFQEYFTAYFIHKNNIEISWLEKLDVPRWQETMINLFLLGHSPELLEQLAASIDFFEGELTAPADASRNSVDQREILLADRVEFASRLIRQTSSHLEIGQHTFQPAVEKTMLFLVQKGNPITQVKMLRTAQNIPELDYTQLLETPLNSKINWVQKQAFIVLSSLQASSKKLGHSLGAELLNDLASGSFIQRMGLYFSALRRPQQGALKIAIVLAFMLFGAGLLVSGLGSALTYKILQNTSDMKARQLFSAQYFGLIYILIVLFIASISIKEKLSPFRAIILGSSIAVFIIPEMLTRMWQGELGDAIGILVILVFSAYLFIMPALALIDFFSITLFYAVTSILGVPTGSLKMVSVKVRDKYGVSLKELLNGYLGIAGLLFMVFIFWLISKISLENLKGSLQAFWVSYWHIIIGFLIGAALIVILKFGRRLLRWSSIENFRNGLLIVFGGSLIIGGYILIAWLFNYISNLISAWLGKITIGYYISKAISVILILVIIVLLVLLINYLRETMAQLIAAFRRAYPPHFFSADQWPKLVEKAPVWRQQDLLLRTNHQSVGQTPEAFLETLRAVESFIKEEPALSTYWSQRDQLEQVLRQERSEG